LFRVCIREKYIRSSSGLAGLKAPRHSFQAESQASDQVVDGRHYHHHKSLGNLGTVAVGTVVVGIVGIDQGSHESRIATDTQSRGPQGNRVLARTMAVL